MGGIIDHDHELTLQRGRSSKRLLARPITTEASQEAFTTTLQTKEPARRDMSTSSRMCSRSDGAHLRPCSGPPQAELS